MYINKGEISQLKLTGARLYTAREMLDITQEQAAKLLGTSKQAVADSEAGKLNPLPLKLLRSAAELYHVSSEWLLGLSDDWERDPEAIKNRDFLSGLYSAHLKNYSELIARQDESDRLSAQAVSAIAEIIEAFESFHKLNPGFENMPGGARLLRAVNAANAAKTINPQLTREYTGKQRLNAQ